MSKLPLWFWILTGLVCGSIWGVVTVSYGLHDFTGLYIKPWGTIFLNLLKLVAIPLIFLSLITGITSLSNTSKISRLGAKTIGFYVITTVIAICLGLLLANLIKPGSNFPETLKQNLLDKYSSPAGYEYRANQEGPLGYIVNIVPDNFFRALTDNNAMLQVIFFSFLFGIALIKIPSSKSKKVIEIIESLNEVILKTVEYIMLFAPFGVFALIAGIIPDFAGKDVGNVPVLFYSLGKYMITVVIGLISIILIIYPSIIYIFNRKAARKFYRGIFPAQIVAFSTSSSAATLPVTMKCCEDNLGLPKKITRFVLPVGATINMDGTSLYQAVATVFIAQVFGHDLTLADQLTIVFTATMASIGSAAVPGAGIIMLVMVLQSVGLSVQGISLIIAVDRILDMLRTVVNITGDSMIAYVLSKEGKERSEG